MAAVDLVNNWEAKEGSFRKQRVNSARSSKWSATGSFSISCHNFLPDLSFSSSVSAMRYSVKT